MAAAYVQDKQGTFASGAKILVTISPTAGNDLIATVFSRDATVSSLSPGSWTRVQQNGTQLAWSDMWAIHNIAAGTTQVTINLSGDPTSSSAMADIVEVSGLTGVVDAHDVNSGASGTTLSTASLTGLASGDFVVAMAAQGGSNTFTGDGKFTQLTGQLNVGNRTFESAYHLPAGTTDSAFWTSDNSATAWNTIIAAFKGGAATYSVSATLTAHPTAGDADAATYKSGISLAGHPAYSTLQGYKVTSTVTGHPVLASTGVIALHVTCNP